MDKTKLAKAWKEHIKPALIIISIGVLVVFGFRIGEAIWPRTSTKVLICFYDDIDTVKACEAFGPIAEDE